MFAFDPAVQSSDPSLQKGERVKGSVVAILWQSQALERAAWLENRVLEGAESNSRQ